MPRWIMRMVASVGSVLHLPLNRERLGKLTENSMVDNSAVRAALGWNEMPVEAEEGLKATLAEFARADKQEESWRIYRETKEAKYV